jgi:hypothetical protein
MTALSALGEDTKEQKMKRLISAVAVAAVAIMAFASVASASVAPRVHEPHTLTATTVYNGVSYVHKYKVTTTSWKDRSFTGVAAAGSVTPGETVNGTLNGPNITINGSYPNGYTWSYSGPLAGGSGSDSMGQHWNISFNTDLHFTTITPYHVNNNDAEWGPDSCSGLHTVMSGMNASTTDEFTCTSTTGKALTGLKPLEHVTLATVGGWGSDYAPATTDANGNDASGFHYGYLAKSLNGIVSLNGKSITAVAAY